jgi:hypothetical protein
MAVGFVWAGVRGKYQKGGPTPAWNDEKSWAIPGMLWTKKVRANALKR